MKKITKKHLIVGMVVVFIFIIGYFAFSSESFNRDSSEKRVERTISNDESTNLFDSSEEKNDTEKKEQSSSILPITVDFDTAMEIALTHAKEGFVSKIEVYFEDNIPYFSLDVSYEDSKKFYFINANSGEIISILSASEIGYTINKPQISVGDILTLIENKYKGALVHSISLNYDSPDQMVYEVVIFSEDMGKVLIISADDASIISEKEESNTSQLT
ncbi:PepSY domain-containing protein [Streptococcus sp. CSL10205-OR2]|uniref:PepSY domain-containing protein n=1 Tax=Streptococcus sp. CSL10205-OR2 TaxID=2980558 RepID=UPI0021DA3F75|nr:PepSY domain-containing protein [Streptococcus sp. CSL10205-OR2]MCU9533583.1 PepSY domain-containing protein [Streptococcus sp. CSL10205-OR2]